MNPQSTNPNLQGAPDAEATLRLIAALPARDGLEDRVHAALAAALESGDGFGRTGRVLAWRTSRGSANSWMRAAAAAAIAVVVAGGGWGVYSRVQQPLSGRLGAPAGIAAPGNLGGFGGAGAIRTPQTLNGPVLTRPAETSKTMKKATGAKATVRKREARAAQPATPETAPQAAVSAGK